VVLQGAVKSRKLELLLYHLEILKAGFLFTALALGLRKSCQKDGFAA